VSEQLKGKAHTDTVSTEKQRSDAWSCARRSIENDCRRQVEEKRRRLWMELISENERRCQLEEEQQH
jgi:hypothetical protein